MYERSDKSNDNRLDGLLNFIKEEVDHKTKRNLMYGHKSNLCKMLVKCKGHHYDDNDLCSKKFCP